MITSLRVLRYAAIADPDPSRGGAPMTEDEFRRWRDNFMYLIDGVQLFGTNAVAEAADKLLAAYAALDMTLQMTAALPNESFAERLQRSWEGPPGDAMLEAGSKLLTAMRTDVAQDAVERRT